MKKLLLALILLISINSYAQEENVEYYDIQSVSYKIGMNKKEIIWSDWYKTEWNVRIDYYKEQQTITIIKEESNFYVIELVKSKQISDLDYYKGEIDSVRIGWLNDLCKETNSAVVLSASMRASWDVPKLQEIFNYCGATFTIIDKTGHDDCRVRGVEIKQWIEANSEKYSGIKNYDFNRYVIIDDDNDMLLCQASHFFQTDNYSGLTPNLCYRIKRYLTHEIF